MLFINTLKAPFITHMLGSASKSFSDIIMNGEMIENAIRNGRIEVGESNQKLVSRGKEDEMNNIAYSRSTSHPGKGVTSQQGSLRQESGMKSSTEKLQFTPILMSYKELYQRLFDAHIVAPFYSKPLQPLYPKWYVANAQCDYHAGIGGHSIESCTFFKKLVERLINMGVVKFDDFSVENLLPNHN